MSVRAPAFTTVPLSASVADEATAAVAPITTLPVVPIAMSPLTVTVPTASIVPSTEMTPAMVLPCAVTRPSAITMSPAASVSVRVVGIASDALAPGAPTVRASPVKSTSRLTVYVPGASSITKSVAFGTRPRSQLAGTLQLPPEALIHRISAIVVENGSLVVDGSPLALASSV